jgi:hypothetical protein
MTVTSRELWTRGVWAEQLEQDSWERIAGAGQSGWDVWDRTDRQDSWYRAAWTGQPGQDSQDRTARTGKRGQRTGTGKLERLMG